MVLKRKRSSSELSTSTVSTFGSSPIRADSFMEMDITPIFPSASFGASHASHQSGRTMKRFRNSRPSEEEVHRTRPPLVFCHISY